MPVSQVVIHSQFGKIHLEQSFFRAHISDSKTRYMAHIEKILEQMPKWREQRLPPPRVSQSEVNDFRDSCRAKN